MKFKGRTDFPKSLAASSQQLATAPARSRPRRIGLSLKGPRLPMYYLHIRPRKSLPPPSRTPRAWRAGVRRRAPVREPGGAANGNQGRMRPRLCSAAVRAGVRPRLRPLALPHIFCPRQRSSVRCPTIQSSARRPARPDTRPWRPSALRSSAQLRCRARAAYHQLKISRATFGHAAQ